MASSPTSLKPVLYRTLYGDHDMFSKIARELRKKAHAQFNFHYVLEEINVKEHLHKLNNHNRWSKRLDRDITVRLEIWGNPVKMTNNIKYYMVTSADGVPICPAVTLQAAQALAQPGDILWERRDWPEGPK
jgi:hypothetical protein